MWLAAIVPATVRGRAIGGLTTAIFLGQFLSPVVAQPAVMWLGLGGAIALAGLIALLLGLLLAGTARSKAGVAPA